MQIRKEYTCPLEIVHDMIRGKWKTIIIFQLKYGTASLSELEKSIAGISQKMLLQHLNELTTMGMVDKISRLVICGMMSHMCIDTTVRVAKSKDYTITLLEDACTTMDLTWNMKSIAAKEVQATFMASLRGMFAEVIYTSTLENML